MEDKAQLLATKLRKLCALDLRDVLPAHVDVAARHGIDSGNAVEQGRFTRSRGTHDAHEFAGLHGKRDVIKRARCKAAYSVHLLDMINFQNRRHTDARAARLRRKHWGHRIHSLPSAIIVRHETANLLAIYSRFLGAGTPSIWLTASLRFCKANQARQLACASIRVENYRITLDWDL